jgi:hypothetical protein
MREKFNSLIKSYGTRTAPVAETMSIGLAADARVSWFLLTIYKASLDGGVPYCLSGLIRQIK